MGTAAELQTAWATLVIESFVQAGITDAVISPGSRSTPFVIAALENEGLHCTSALDERSGAYFALGQARRTLRPSLLICTSGSAPANYFPAVIEASEGGVPLIVLSADRPPELRGCGANQTTDQIGLYGNKVRFFANLGEPRDDETSLHAVKRVVAQAVSEALGVKPGPVHLNVQARKPLEPTLGGGELQARVDAILHEPLTKIYRARPLDPKLVEHVSPLVVDAVAEALDAAMRPVILCGPSDLRSSMFVDALDELAERSGAVVLAETTSQFRCWAESRALGAFDTIWQTESGRSMCLPDFVLQVGASPISTGWEQLCAAHRIRRIVVHPWQWADPSSTAEAIVQADVGSFLSALCASAFSPARRDDDFVAGFEWAESAVWDEVSAILAQAGDSLTQAGAARALIDAIPDPSVLVLGNSLPIRDVDRWVPPSKKLLAVCSQRGVSGIDGVVSGAAGVASWVDGATTLLIGDVSFLHDLNGLQLASLVSGPLVIVVVNNEGGRIFEQLPIARDGKEAWLPYFTTPHDADLECAALVYGCEFLQRRQPDRFPSGTRAWIRPRRLHRDRGGRAATQCAESRARPRCARRTGAATRGFLMWTLLHGFTGLPQNYGRIARYFGVQQRPLIPALTGHAGDWQGRAADSFEGEVSRLLALLSDVERPRLLCGYSLGARVALGMLSRAPTMFDGAVLIGLHPGLEATTERDERRALDAGRARLLREEGLAAFMEAWEALPLFATQRDLPPNLLAEQREWRLAHDPEGLARSLEVLGLAEMPNYRAAMASLDVPITLMTGSLDVKFSKMAKDLASQNDRIRAERVDGVGHNLLLEAPSLVAAALTRVTELAQ